METLLVVAVVITALAIVVQAGVLISMFLTAKKLTANVDGLISESKRLIPPLEQIGQNVKAASDDMVVVGKIARDQMNHVALMVEDTHLAVTEITSDVSQQVSDTVHHVRKTVTAPLRQASAIRRGVAEALRVLVKGQEETTDRSDYRERPAA